MLKPVKLLPLGPEAARARNLCGPEEESPGNALLDRLVREPRVREAVTLLVFLRERTEARLEREKKEWGDLRRERGKGR